jgi:dihydroflavonol-4-reductase
MICLVTGATGFIGSQLCRELIKEGNKVRALCRQNSKLLALKGINVEIFVGDILEPETLSSAMQGVDWVFHAAGRAKHWRDDPLLIKTIIDGTKNVLNAAHSAEIERLVYTSSSAALGFPEGHTLLNEHHQFNTSPEQWPYGFAKSVAEKEVMLAVEAGLDCVIVNPTSVFGPGDLNVVGGTLILQGSRWKVPITTKGGMNAVHIDDVVAGHLAAAKFGKSGQRYIIGGHNLTHSELMKIIAAQCGTSTSPIMIPPVLIKLAATGLDVLCNLLPLPYNAKLLRLSTYYFYYNTSKSQRELHLPDPLPVTQAISEAVTWYRENGYI